MSAVVIFALSTPLVLRLARRYSFGRQGWRRALAVHFAAGTAISAAWAAFHITLDSAFAGNFGELKLSSFPRLIFVTLDKELLVYWIIVVISHAAEFTSATARVGGLEGQIQDKMQLTAIPLQRPELHLRSSTQTRGRPTSDRSSANPSAPIESSAAQVVPLRQESEFAMLYRTSARASAIRLTTRIEVERQVLRLPRPNITPDIVENASATRLTARRARPRRGARRACGRLATREVRETGAACPRRAESAPGTQGGGVGLANTRAVPEALREAYRFDSRTRRGRRGRHGEIPRQGSAAEGDEVPARGRRRRARKPSHTRRHARRLIPRLRTTPKPRRPKTAPEPRLVPRALRSDS